MFCILNVIIYCILMIQGFPGGSNGKESACNAGDLGSIPELGRSLEGGMATHSSILAWTIPWTEEPGRIQSRGSQRVGYNWATKHILMIQEAREKSFKEKHKKNIFTELYYIYQYHKFTLFTGWIIFQYLYQWCLTWYKTLYVLYILLTLDVKNEKIMWNKLMLIIGTVIHTLIL